MIKQLKSIKQYILNKRREEAMILLFISLPLIAGEYTWYFGIITVFLAIMILHSWTPQIITVEKPKKEKKDKTVKQVPEGKYVDGIRDVLNAQAKEGRMLIFREKFGSANTPFVGAQAQRAFVPLYEVNGSSLVALNDVTLNRKEEQAPEWAE